MNILIVTPAPPGSTRGNRITAQRYSSLLKSLGHQVQVATQFNRLTKKTTVDYDLLIALHARRSAKSIANFREFFPLLPIVLVMTGTDLHHDLHRASSTAARSAVDKSLKLADRIVLLEPEGGKQLPLSLATKLQVVYQSAVPINRKPSPLKRCFEVSLIGHLRSVKAPFLAAQASCCLPSDSKIRIVHLGEAMTVGMERQAIRETERNPRYRWLGRRTHGETQRYLARSRLTVLTSKIEGAPALISEAVVNDIPILATRIPATVGLLGQEHPGLFPVGDVKQLARLMERAESDKNFYQSLSQHGRTVKQKFSPKSELKNWRSLLSEFKSAAASQ